MRFGDLTLWGVKLPNGTRLAIQRPSANDPVRTMKDGELIVSLIYEASKHASYGVEQSPRPTLFNQLLVCAVSTGLDPATGKVNWKRLSLPAPAYYLTSPVVLYEAISRGLQRVSTSYVDSQFVVAYECLMRGPYGEKTRQYINILAPKRTWEFEQLAAECQFPLLIPLEFITFPSCLASQFTDRELEALRVLGVKIDPSSEEVDPNLGCIIPRTASKSAKVLEAKLTEAGEGELVDEFLDRFPVVERIISRFPLMVTYLLGSDKLRGKKTARNEIYRKAVEKVRRLTAAK